MAPCSRCRKWTKFSEKRRKRNRRASGSVSSHVGEMTHKTRYYETGGRNRMTVPLTWRRPIRAGKLGRTHKHIRTPRLMKGLLPPHLRPGGDPRPGERCRRRDFQNAETEIALKLSQRLDTAVRGSMTARKCLPIARVTDSRTTRRVRSLVTNLRSTLPFLRNQYRWCPSTLKGWHPDWTLEESLWRSTGRRRR